MQLQYIKQSSSVSEFLSFRVLIDTPDYPRPKETRLYILVKYAPHHLQISWLPMKAGLCDMHPASNGLRFIWQNSQYSPYIVRRIGESVGVE
jgi:hypothetical protein